MTWESGFGVWNLEFGSLDVGERRDDDDDEMKEV